MVPLPEFLKVLTGLAMNRHRVAARLLLIPAIAAALSSASLLSGCGSAPIVGDTPIFSSKERFARISRNWGLELKMLNDDLDRALLLRPVSTLTEWNVP